MTRTEPLKCWLCKHDQPNAMCAKAGRDEYGYVKFPEGYCFEPAKIIAKDGNVLNEPKTLDLFGD